MIRNDGARPAIFPGMAASPECLKFAASLNLRYYQFGFESQKAFQPKLCPLIKDYCLLSNVLQFVHVEVISGEGKLVSVSAIPVMV